MLLREKVLLILMLFLLENLYKNIKLETFYQSINNEEFQSVVFQFKTKEDKMIEYPLMPLIGFKNNIICKADKKNKGIKCKDLKDCEIISKNEFYQDTFYNQIYSYKNASVSFYLKNQNEFQQNFPLSFRYNFQQKYKWPLLDSGVFGISTSFDFTSYLNEQKMFSLLFIYYLNLKNQMEMDVYLNENLDKYYQKQVIDFTNKEYFQVENSSLQILNSVYEFKNQDLCISNLESAVLVTPNSNELCQEINQKLCQENHCKYTKQIFDKAPELKIIIKGLVYFFQGQDYLYEDSVQKGVLKCWFAEPWNQMQNGICNASFGIGKHFLMKYPLQILAKENKEIQLIFYQSKIKPNFHWLKYWQLILIGVFFMVCLIIFIKSKQQEIKEVDSLESDEYTTI